jgi:hypothetical protein
MAPIQMSPITKGIWMVTVIPTLKIIFPGLLVLAERSEQEEYTHKR